VAFSLPPCLLTLAPQLLRHKLKAVLFFIKYRSLPAELLRHPSSSEEVQALAKMKRPSAPCGLVYGVNQAPRCRNRKEGSMTYTSLGKGYGEEASDSGRKHTKESLLRSIANLSDFVEKAPEGLGRLGADGLILWANQAELDMLGYTREEYIGHRINEFHVDAPVIEDILDRLARGETLRGREARMARKDGSIRYVMIDANALVENGKFIHARCFTRDITDRKRAEEKLISAYERESAARAAAEASNRNKDEFISVVLTALRPSLNAILNSNRMLRDYPLDAAQLKKSFELIERNARAQLRLIEDLLDPARAAKLPTVRRLMLERGADYEAMLLQGRNAD
jgi:PAS domain S-box-containing protein